ncbi:MAG: MlaD family protein [Acidobacteriota bacterium]
MSTRRNEIVTGLFVTAAAVVFGLFAFKVGNFDLMGLLEPDAVTGRTTFSNVKTLQVGSKVRVGGREVGEVVEVELVDGEGKADANGLQRLVNQVTFELTNPELRLDPASARVALAQDSLLAPHYLELDPGRWAAGAAPPPMFEADLPAPLVIESLETAGLEELIAMAYPAIEGLATMASRVNQELLTPENLATVRQAISELDATLIEGRELATTLNRRLLGDANVERFERTLANLDQAVADGREVTDRLARVVDPEQDPRLDTFLTDIAAVTGELRTEIDAVSTRLDQLLDRADQVVGDTEAELAEATRRLQRTLWQGEMALRKIRSNPSVLLFGDDETDLEAGAIDFSEIRLRGRARPYEQRDERDEPR